MKKFISFFLGLFLFLCPIAVQAEEIAEAPSPDPMSEEAISFLQGEDIYQGSLSWQGNKSLTKFNYDKPNRK
tara:strand:- start:222 stop:437 length:216 start_codon:yes stop_codon:yes gene_type:complete